MGNLSLWVGTLLVPFSPILAAAPASGARNLQVLIPGPDFFRPAAVLKIESVSQEHRRVGFFSVKLLPIVVVKGVSLELSAPGTDTNWVNSFRFQPGSSAARANLEWREVSVRLPGDSTPRLRAQRLRPPPVDGEQACVLEEVTLQTASGPLNLHKARLLLEGAPGRLVWEDHGQIRQWNLLSGALLSETLTASRNNDT